MQTAYCALSVALKQFPDEPELEKAKKHLEAAVNLSGEYHKTYWSIFWKTSTERTKKRIREKCNHLAFETYSQMIDLGDLLNKYAEKQSSPEPKSWRELISNLSLAFDWINQEHLREINSRQLSINFDICQSDEHLDLDKSLNCPTFKTVAQPRPRASDSYHPKNER